MTNIYIQVRVILTNILFCIGIFIVQFNRYYITVLLYNSFLFSNNKIRYLQLGST